jgi:hypothetical protein
MRKHAMCFDGSGAGALAVQHHVCDAFGRRAMRLPSTACDEGHSVVDYLLSFYRRIVVHGGVSFHNLGPLNGGPLFFA